MTKSRARHSNDNALAESKNGSIVRKYFGYVHIKQHWAPLINEFNRNHLTPYINFHRPCYFAEIKVDKKGKEIKTYPYNTMMTPYEKFKSLPNAEQYLKPGVSFANLDKQMLMLSDLQAVIIMKKAKQKLFQIILKSDGDPNILDVNESCE